MKKTLTYVIMAAAIMTFALWEEIEPMIFGSPTINVDLTPRWDAVAAWPGVEVDTASADPEPGRTTTVLVFDDSGSMSRRINAAKIAALDFAGKLPETTHIGAIGLNSGVLVEPMPVDDALPVLTSALGGVIADGGTPLSRALRQAHNMLRLEAANQRGFGNYQILVTTDGEADNPSLLTDEVVAILRNSPVNIATIGIGIGDGHPLNLGGETRYVAISDVADLASALEDVSAEQTQFDPVTAFEETN
ncbi:MAG: vWA domain-containing protein [Pseudomonadota bacterium]